jgi:hypothetical protein
MNPQVFSTTPLEAFLKQQQLMFCDQKSSHPLQHRANCFVLGPNDVLLKQNLDCMLQSMLATSADWRLGNAHAA